MDGETRAKMIEAARGALANSYAPYSGFAVGAAVLTASGDIFTGCNLENASYPVGMCAERSALGAAVAAGHKEIAAVAIVTRGREPCPPCGMCRQALAEFGPSMDVVMASDGGTRESTLDRLLPEGFGPAFLGRGRGRSD